MKKRELAEARAKSLEVLEGERSKLADKLLVTKVAVVSSKETNLRAVRAIRRDIAQISGIIHEKSVEQKEEKKA
jgi:ribosomal protein L29